MSTPLPAALFVDDEPFILDGLRRMLRPLRTEWELHFAESGAKALELMATQPFGVVVSDMRMPLMNGAQLLREVQQRYPLAIRVILSGHADKDLVTQCVGVAHQYLSKPCDAEVLKITLATLGRMAGPEVPPEVRRLVGSLEQLPTLPSLFRELQATLKREDAGPELLGAIIQKDPVMTAKVLKMVNSAFFGLRRSVSTAPEAVAYLGIETIKTLVLAHGVFGAQPPLACQAFTLEELWNHSFLVATRAATLAQIEGKDRPFQNLCFSGGILQDIGLLVFASGLPALCNEASARIKAEHQRMPQVEQGLFGCTHAEVGAYLLGLWGLPPELLRIIREHHGLGLRPGCGFTPSLAVHAADLFAGMEGAHPLFESEAEDLLELETLGFAQRLPHWKEACLSLDQKEGGP